MSNLATQELPTLLYTTGTDPAPIRASDFLPQSYLLQIEETLCSHCSALHCTSTVYMVKTHQSLTARTAARIRVPVDELRQTLPIGTTTLRQRKTPFCHLCYTTVPQSEPHSPISELEWARALQLAAQRDKDTAIAAALREARAHQSTAPRRAPLNIMEIPL